MKLLGLGISFSSLAKTPKPALLLLAFNTDILRLLPPSCLIVLRAVSFLSVGDLSLCAFVCEEETSSGKGRLVDFVLLLTLLKKKIIKL